ncbi:MAG TPA: hypothetical protein VEQ60_27790 [Longimicrobium sp.]|nr:hypothetical protein [Longimicrobium sp.]
MSDVHTFAPRRKDARTESLAGAAVAALMVLGFLYLGQGERDWRVLSGLAAFGAALVLSGHLVRTRFQWVDEIHLSAQDATLVRNGAPETLPWTQVKSVRHTTRGGEQWVLEAHRGHRPMTIRADGLNREEAARLRELIPALHAAARPAAEPAPR